MIVRRRWPSETPRSRKAPSPSGPRCRSVPVMRARVSRETASPPPRVYAPAMPHMVRSLLDPARVRVDEHAVPLLEHEEAPDPVAVVPPAGAVRVEDPLQDPAIEIAALERPTVEEPVAGVRLEILAEPDALRNAESLLGLP